jgi:hypothetical protein
VAVVFTIVVGFLPSPLADMSQDASFEVPEPRTVQAEE